MPRNSIGLKADGTVVTFVADGDSALKNATVKLTQLNTQFGEPTVAFAAGRMESVLHSLV